MSKQVVVIDYGIGNVFSVCNALLRVDATPVLSADPAVICQAERVILPGVGAFSKAMDNLRRQGLDHAIAAFIATGRPFLGICIGMQVLMERSTELGEHVGLGYIKGSVDRLKESTVGIDKIKVPHIGWRNIVLHKKSELIGQKENYFYFVHSYTCNTAYDHNLLATVNCPNGNISAVIGIDNILGVQFHPERSGPDGLRFLQRFSRK